jgi:hypothetical protein
MDLKRADFIKTLNLIFFCQSPLVAMTYEVGFTDIFSNTSGSVHSFEDSNHLRDFCDGQETQIILVVLGRELSPLTFEKIVKLSKSKTSDVIFLSLDRASDALYFNPEVADQLLSRCRNIAKSHSLSNSREATGS